MNSDDLRQAYIDFFLQHGHKQISGASLIPENDPTVLFTTAGMHPLVPYLMGEEHPSGKRLCNWQKCIRTGDIEDVGNTQHLTYFEMLGNWSLGDYFKEEAIKMSFEFLTSPNWLSLNKEKLFITVFEGDNVSPKDNESAEIWKKLGIDESHIYFLGKSDNWWGPAGSTGPCGPDTEMFFDTGKTNCSVKCSPGCSCGKYVEIWNDVFMQYEKMSDGTYISLSRKNVDTGMGLERTVATLNSYSSVYKIDKFAVIIKEIEKLSCMKYDENEKTSRAMRIISDHVRSAVFIMGDPLGVPPSNLDQGYVVRRLIRRAMRHAMLINIKSSLAENLVDLIIETNKVHEELREKRDYIIQSFSEEEDRFKKTLRRGINEFWKILPNILKTDNKLMSGRVAFKLYDTYGFPYDMTRELADEQGVKVDENGFNKAFKKHQELSRSKSNLRFKGGLADAGEQTKQLHTATHLLHEALKRVLGDHIKQKGSNITTERLRFDFSHPKPVSPEQIKKVEEIVNDIIDKKIDVIEKVMEIEEAIKSGAIALFVDKYAKNVKVYVIGDFSKEVCGGPHVSNTGELGKFVILKEQSSSAGIRRIKAVLE